MGHSEAQPVSGGVHLILYDGDCGLCSRLVQFLLRQDRHGLFNFASIQSAVGKCIVERSSGSPGELASFYVLADYRSTTPVPCALTKSDAVLFVADALGWPWRAARIMRVLPRSIRDRGYDLLERNRYRLFGRHECCVVSSAEFRNRFIR